MNAYDTGRASASVALGLTKQADWDFGGNLLGTVGQNFRDIAATGWNNAKSIGGAVGNAAAGVGRAYGNAAAGYGSALGQGAQNIAGSIGQGPFAPHAAAGDAMLGTAGALWNGAKGVGSAIGQGARGISGAFGGAARNTAQTLGNAAKSTGAAYAAGARNNINEVKGLFGGGAGAAGAAGAATSAAPRPVPTGPMSGANYDPNGWNSSGISPMGTPNQSRMPANYQQHMTDRQGGGNQMSLIEQATRGRQMAAQAGLHVGKNPFSSDAAAQKFLQNNPQIAKRVASGEVPSAAPARPAPRPAAAPAGGRGVMPLAPAVSPEVSGPPASGPIGIARQARSPF